MTGTMALERSADPMVWIDCEMTGLDPETESILSISCFVTDAQLNVLDRLGFDVVIHHTEERLSKMDQWCTTTHGASGLTKAVLESHITADEAAEALLEYVKRYVPQARKGLLAGNSVHADKAFLSKRPYDKLLAHLHYRILDVSSIKEAIRRWAPEAVLEGAPKKKGLHEARADILESIEEARYYRRLFERFAL